MDYRQQYFNGIGNRDRYNNSEGSYCGACSSNMGEYGNRFEETRKGPLNVPNLTLKH